MVLISVMGSTSAVDFESILASSCRPPCYGAEESADSLNVWVDLPELASEEVKVTADLEWSSLFIEAEGGRDSDSEGIGRKYSGGLDLHGHDLKLSDVKAEMKDELLKMVVPKIK